MNPFEIYAERYDAWYESPYGREAFERERDCLLALAGGFNKALEVGTGSGIFSSALGIKHGVDPPLSLLEMARERGS